MKTLFIGLVLGAIAVWTWYHTGGKIHITETTTVTVTNEVFVTITETQLVEHVTAVTRTNEVWKTNVVERIQPPAVVTKKPVVPVQPKTPPPKQDTSGKWSLSGSHTKPAAAAPPAGGGVMFNDGNGRSYRIVNGRRVYY